MSESKLVMAAHLARVQVNLMGRNFDSVALDTILPIIFEECLKENMTFWFSFIENTCVLNLRDTLHENYELNIRLHHETGDNHEEIKKELLVNTFLITSTSSQASSATDTQLISNDKPVPAHIQDAIKLIQQKGIPVTREAIKNHLPLSEMSTSCRLECNRYLKNMEVSE